MLQLARRIGESVVIDLGGGVLCTVTYLGLNQWGGARLGLEAPIEVRIDRAEKRVRQDVQSRRPGG